MSDEGMISYRSFCGSEGDSEFFLSLSPPGGLSMKEQLIWLHKHYEALHLQLKLKPETAIFRRIFLSDVANQMSFLNESAFLIESENNPVAISVVQQPPQPDMKISFFAYHVKSALPVMKTRLSDSHLLIEKKGHRYLWSTRLCCHTTKKTMNEAAQTLKVFKDLVSALETLGANLRDHCVRTWIYIRDVDLFYADFVKARRKLFSSQGLTEKTHYIASTGIEGHGLHQFDTVLMDAYSVLDPAPGQINFLNDFSHLNRTIDYNVTFERGTKISYADREHLFISGTASIDKNGKVMYSGDVFMQLERALTNIEALLKTAAATLDDLMYLIVYLRDAADAKGVRAKLQERFLKLPIMIVEGAVCRPEWLIELEGVAIKANQDPFLPSF